MVHYARGCPGRVDGRAELCDNRGMSNAKPVIIPDPFQKEAIALIESGETVLVSAPTGAGKTLVAEAAIRSALAAGKHVIYTAPVKALSNQKYRDFREQYGDERVGVLTGDVSINPDAAILIMTTEIFRNSLFEASDRIQKTGWVIFDEIHYLDDPERGTVWEEALLFTPPEICILALSATVPNVRELAAWMESVRGKPVRVVEEMTRPVPLDFIFQCQAMFFENTKLLRHHGYLTRENWGLTSREKSRGLRPLRAKPNRLDSLLERLKRRAQLPVIYFAFGRQRTADLAWEASAFDFCEDEKDRAKLVAMFEDLLGRYGLMGERSAEDMRPLIERGIAYHHAGMLPSLKEIIERLFTSRLIKVIFTTETFALGINMPARSVVFDEMEKFYGHGFEFLSTRDFYQMAGRAGRRGMDEKGHVYIRTQPNRLPFNELTRIVFGKPEAIRSQLNTTYATVLNLYARRGERLLEIYPRSFHHWQSSQKNRLRGHESLEHKLALLKELGLIQDGQITDKGRFAASLFGYELLLAEMYFEGALQDLDEAGFNVLVSGLIFEPRRDAWPPRLKPKHEKIRKMAEHAHRKIHREEARFKVWPYTKPPHFHMAEAVEAWTEGETFDKLFSHTQIDEGEIVRHFRMIIQVQRELLHAAGPENHIRSILRRAIEKINRDWVDAEKQLKI